VTLTVADDDGEASDTLLVTVNNVLPSVDAGPDQVVDEGDTVSFSGSFTDPGVNDPATVTWDFGDGSPPVTGTLTPEHVYPDDGVYTVTLTVADDDGEASDTLQVTVRDSTPPEQTIDDLVARAKPTKVDLIWTPVAGADGYNVYRSLTPGGPYEQIAQDHLCTFCAYADFGLTNGVTYYYVVTSVSGGVESLISNEASATPTATRTRTRQR
jgi:PKD repeat protein